MYEKLNKINLVGISNKYRFGSEKKVGKYFRSLQKPLTSKFQPNPYEPFSRSKKYIYLPTYKNF